MSKSPEQFNPSKETFENEIAGIKMPDELLDKAESFMLSINNIFEDEPDQIDLRKSISLFLKEAHRRIKGMADNEEKDKLIKRYDEVAKEFHERRNRIGPPPRDMV